LWACDGWRRGWSRANPGADVLGDGRWRATGTGRHSPTTTNAKGGARTIRGRFRIRFPERGARAARPLRITARIRAPAREGRARGVRRLLRASSMRCCLPPPAGGRQVAEGTSPSIHTAPTQHPPYRRGIRAGAASRWGLCEISLRQVRGPGPGTKEWAVVRDGQLACRRWAHPSRSTPPCLSQRAAQADRGISHLCRLGRRAPGCFLFSSLQAPTRRARVINTGAGVRAPCTPATPAGKVNGAPPAAIGVTVRPVPRRPRASRSASPAGAYARSPVEACRPAFPSSRSRRRSMSALFPPALSRGRSQLQSGRPLGYEIWVTSDYHALLPTICWWAPGRGAGVESFFWAAGALNTWQD